MWRYRKTIPILDDESIVTLGEGGTPLIEIDFGKRSALVKQEQLMPTGSFKDRGASVLVSHMKGLGIKQAVIDSSGNAASAVAAYSARAGIACDVFIPAGTAAGKCAQIRAYGAHLHEIRGSRAETARAALKYAVRTYYASHYWNPFFFQGIKTLSYEIYEQLDGRAPDTIILPCGNGTLVLGAYIGFCDLVSARIIPRMPRIIAVQSAACAPVFHAFRRRLKHAVRISPRPTLAEGIAIAEPLRSADILRAVGEARGSIMAVNEHEIERALRLMLERGFYIEPTAAVAVAGLVRYLPYARKNEIVVSVFTGHGLKTSEKTDRILSG